MSDTTLNKAARSLIAAGTSVSAGGAQRAVLDLRTSLGGLLTFKITNGATGPTLPCECRILAAHNDGSTPAAAAAGADWKTLYRVAAGTANNAAFERSYEVPAGVMHLEVEFTGNTGQAVTAEAYLSELVKAVST